MGSNPRTRRVGTHIIRGGDGSIISTESPHNINSSITRSAKDNHIISESKGSGKINRITRDGSGNIIDEKYDNMD